MTKKQPRTKSKLTLAQISPTWSKTIKKFGYILKFAGKHAINEFACCIVGEAHGFKDNYLKPDGEDCMVCADFSLDFYNLYNWDDDGCAVTIKRFERHWNRIQKK